MRITPLVVNRIGLDYHAYHGYNFTQVDPRFESSGATFQDLTWEAHAREICIVLDIVIRHSPIYQSRGTVHNACASIS